MKEINLLEHPFKREMSLKIKNEYTHFDYHYFDNPKALSGFRGFFEEGNSAEGHRDSVKEAQTIASIPGLRNVLDVGCAKGFLVKALRNLGIQAYGIDISEYALSKAEANIRPYLRQMRVQDIESVEQYDIVHTSGVLVYLKLPEIKKVLQCFYRIAKIGIIVVDPTREQIQAWYDGGSVEALDPLRKQELFQREWDALIRSAGFRKDGIFYKKTPFIDRTFLFDRAVNSP